MPLALSADMKSVLVASSLAALGAALSPASAHACSAAAPCLQASTLPADGESGVVRNARVLVVYSDGTGWGEPSLPLQLDIGIRPIGGELLASDVTRLELQARATETVFELAPKAALEANTTYEVVHTLDSLDGGCHLARVSELVTLSTFTTGAQADTLAP